MDFSKLPRMSNTGTSPAPTGADPAPVPQQQTSSSFPAADQTQNPGEIGAGAEAWFGVIVGVLLLFLGRPFGSYLISLLTHKPYHTGVEWTDELHQGQEVAYPDLVGGTLYSDSGPFIFGVAMIIAALSQLLLSTRSKARGPVAFLSLSIMVLATVYNAYVMFKIYEFGVPVISLLCVGFGGYISYYQWRAIKRMQLQNSLAAPLTGR